MHWSGTSFRTHGIFIPTTKADRRSGIVKRSGMKVNGIFPDGGQHYAAQPLKACCLPKSRALASVRPIGKLGPICSKSVRERNSSEDYLGNHGDGRGVD